MNEFKVDEYREMISQIHNWSYNLDFTYRSPFLYNGKRFFKAFVISQFWDLNIPVSSIRELKEILRAEGEEFTKKDELEIIKCWERLGLA